MAGELQTMLTWAEDRALLRSTLEPAPSQGPRPEPELSITSALCSSSPDPQHDSSGIGTDATNLRGIDAARSGPRCTFPIHIYANRTKSPFHGEPRHHYSFWFLLNVGKPSHKTFPYFERAARRSCSKTSAKIGNPSHQSFIDRSHLALSRSVRRALALTWIRDVDRAFRCAYTKSRLPRIYARNVMS